MKGFLTFTLAAGVAITTGSVAQAAGVTKGAASLSKAPVAVQAPMGLGSMGLALDRVSLTRELERLNQMLNPSDDFEGNSTTNSPVPSKVTGMWTY